MDWINDGFKYHKMSVACLALHDPLYSFQRLAREFCKDEGHKFIEELEKVCVTVLTCI